MWGEKHLAYVDCRGTRAKFCSIPPPHLRVPLPCTCLGQAHCPCRSGGAPKGSFRGGSTWDLTTQAVWLAARIASAVSAKSGLAAPRRSAWKLFLKLSPHPVPMELGRMELKLCQGFNHTQSAAIY